MMKTRILLLVMLLVGIMAKAQNIEVSGMQSGAWDADTVRVIGDVVVGKSLEILPGTVVLFDGFYSISVIKDASFTAQGAEADSIVFTVADTLGLCHYNSPKGGWNGFHLENAGKVSFDYCVLEYAKASDTLDMSGGAMRIENCDEVAVTHSTLRFNRARQHGGAISADDSHVVMMDCQVNDNLVYYDDGLYYRYGGALKFFKCDVELRVMDILRNQGDGCIGGAISFDSCSVVLDRAVFADNIGLNGGGLYMMRSNHLPGRLSNLLFDNNRSHHFAGGLAFADCSPEVYNILVTNNQSEGVNCAGIFFYQYASPKLTNCIVYGNYNDSGAVFDETAQMWVWTFEDDAPEFRNCLIEGGAKYITNAEYIKVFEDILEDDPKFVDVEHHDFRLTEGSPCRDSGNEKLPEDLAEGFDLIGIRRVSNQRVDIGPYEYSETSVSQYLGGSSEAKLVGNPLSDKSRVVFGDEWDGDVTVTIYSINGRQAAQKACHLTKATSLELGSWVEPLPAGVYLIEVAGPNRTLTLKAVK